jgi:hypothetical protein
MNPKKRIPIERLNKFFSEEDFDLEIDFGREWLESDINIKVILYRVDRTESTIDDVYGEAGKGEIRFKPPVEIPVSFKMDTPTNKSYNGNGSLKFLEYGNVTLGVYQDTLDDLGVDITYGDLMACEFTAEAPNKIKVVEYTSYHSKFDPSNTVFGLVDDSLQSFINFLNRFEGMKLKKEYFKFLDQYDNYSPN